MKLTKVYNDFVKHISYPLIARYNGQKTLCKCINALEKTQYETSEKILERQTEKLKILLQHAYRNTRYYQRKFDECGFNPDDFKHPDQMKLLPLLSKNDIRCQLKDLVPCCFSKDDIHFSETGGTTGVKMIFARNNECLGDKEAALLRFEKWAGWDLGARKGIVWPALQDYVGKKNLKAKIKNELFERCVVFPAVILDEKSMDSYIERIKKRKPSIIRGFTSPLHELSRHILKAKHSFPFIKGIITTGEPLYGHQRSSISKAFNCPVYNSYRSRECGPVAQECEMMNGLHINADGLFLEIVPLADTDQMKEGLGEIVITDLWNFGMPLIRYRTGDLGLLSDQICSCGRGLPLLKEVCGRTPDVFYTTSGKPFAAITLVLYLVDEAPGLLGQVQIIQDEVDHILIRMTPDPPPTETIKEYQTRTVKKLMGNDMKVSFEIVESIPRESGGKYLFAKCLIGDNSCDNIKLIK